MCLVASLVASVLPAFGAEEKAEGESEPVVFRVMTYNIHHGRGMDDRVDLERIAEVIKKAAPDLVALQEVDKGTRRTDGRDLTAELAKLTGMEGYFEKNIPYQGGDYGNAILSKFRILEKKNTHLRMIRENEQRGALGTLVEVNGEKLLFVSTHIDHRGDDSERLLNVAQFQEIAAEYPGVPVIFAGDFNDRPGSRTHKRMKENYIDSWEAVGEGDGFTFRSDRPDRRIDYIWLSRESGLTPRKAKVERTEASDHLPLVVEVEFVK